MTEKPTIPIADLRNARVRKVAALRELGINPYPSRSHRTHDVGPLVAEFERFDGQRAVVAGRLLSFRKMGALTFGHVQDQTGRIQLYFRRDTVRPTDVAAGTLGYADLNLLDIGDLVEAAGT